MTFSTKKNTLSLIGLLVISLISNIKYAESRQSNLPDTPSLLKRYEYREIHMGVAARLVVYAPSETRAQSACEAAFNRFAELEQVMSDYRPSSELMQLCAKAGGPPVTVSRDLFDVLTRAQNFSRKSDGAFDITVGPLVQLW